MSLNLDHRFICKAEDCKTKKLLWKCDICGRTFCEEHSMDLHHVHEKLEIRNNKTINTMYENNVRRVCYDCMSLAELWEIDNAPSIDLPLLINRNFVTDRADAYYYRRATGGERDPHIFDFGVKMLKDLAKKVRKELEKEK